MKVPTVDQQVAPQAPYAPEAQAPRPIEEAYGPQVAEAQAGVGKAVSGLGDVLAQHAVEQMKWGGEAKAFDGVSQLKEYMQNATTNTEPTEIIDATGNKKTVPSGYLVREGHDTDGIHALAAVDFRRQYDKIMSTIPVFAQASYARFAQSAMDGYLEHVNTHEATEGRKATTNDILSPIYGPTGFMSRAAADKTPEELTNTINSINFLNDRADKYNGLDEGTTEAKTKAAFRAVSNSVTSAAMHDPVLAQKLLDSQADKIGPESYNLIQPQIERVSNAAQKQQLTEANKAIAANDLDIVHRMTGPIAQQPTEAEMVQKMQLGAAKDPNGISKTVYDAWKEGRKPAQLTTEEKDSLRNDVMDAAAKITTDDKQKNIDPHAKFEDIANYKAALIRAQGAYSPMQYQARAGVIQKVFDKGLDQEVNSAYGNTNIAWDSLKKHLGYAVEGLPGSPEFNAAKAGLGHDLMEKLVKGPIPDDQLHSTVQSILSKYIVKNNPEVAGAEKTPNNVASKNGVKPLIDPQVLTRTIKGLAGSEATPQKTFKVGDEEQHNGATYVRQENGTWTKKR